MARRMFSECTYDSILPSFASRSKKVTARLSSSASLFCGSERRMATIEGGIPAERRKILLCIETLSMPVTT